MNTKRSYPSQSKSNYHPIKFSGHNLTQIPVVQGCSVDLVQKILACAISQSLDDFICTQKYLMKKMNRSKRTISTYFNQLLDGGFIEQIKAGNRFTDELRRFKIGDSYRHEIHPYVSDYKEGAVSCTLYTYCDEIPELTPVFASSGMGFLEENEDLAEVFEKDQNLYDLTRLPKATIAEGPKSATQSGKYKDMYTVPLEILKEASNLYILGGQATFMKGSVGRKVKQDFNRRLGVLLVKWGYHENPNKALDRGGELMRDINRRDFKNNQEFSEGLDEYFISQGIKGSKKALDIINVGR